MRLINNLLTMSLILGTVAYANAQSNDLIAKSSYLKAQEMYGNGNYGEALDKLAEVVNLLGESNPRVEYLIFQCHFAQFNIEASKKSIDRYFKLATESDPNYMGMIQKIDEVNTLIKTDKLYRRDRLFLSLEQMPRTKIAQEFSYVQDIVSPTYIHPENNLPAIFVALALNDDRRIDAYFQNNPISTTLADDLGHTLLHFAAQSKRLDLVKQLIEQGASPSQTCKDGHTPLHFAARGGQLANIEYLISKGASPAAATPTGITIAHSAAFEGQIEILKRLKSKSVNLNTSSTYGRTPLFSACSGGSIATVEYLLSQGATLTHIASDGSTVVHAVVDAEMMKYLKNKGLDIFAKDKNQWDAMNLAARYNRPEVVQYLHSQGVPLSGDVNGTANVILAGFSGSVDMLSYFQKNGINMLETDAAGWQAIGGAARSGSMLAVNYLLALGADINSKNTDQSTLMHHAAISGNVELLEFLRAQGLSLLSKDMYGQEPIHLAAQFGKIGAIEYLLSNGASLTSMANGDIQSIHRAASGSSTKTMDYILRKGISIHVKTGDGGTPILVAANWGQESMVKHLLSKGAYLYDKTTNGYTIAHWAARSGSVSILTFITSQDPTLLSATSVEGELPITIAAINGRLDVVNYLLGNSTHTKKQLKDAIDKSKITEIQQALQMAMNKL